MRVRDLMNTEPAVISPKEGLDKGLALMAARKNRHLMVVDEASNVVGILSDQDMAMVYDPRNMTETRWKAITVEEVMTPNPITIGSNATIEEAAQNLLKEAVSALPVVDNGQLVGALSDRDFTRHFAQSADEREGGGD
ncbi:MAG: CBS domain-containing protein [bacterium]